MEDVVDRVEVSAPVAAPPGSAVGRSGAPSLAAEPVPSPRNAGRGWVARLNLSRGLIAARQRRFDDIPSVVRALLVGYDEV